MIMMEDGVWDGWMDGSCFGSFKGIGGETKKQKGNPPKKRTSSIHCRKIPGNGGADHF